MLDSKEFDIELLSCFVFKIFFRRITDENFICIEA